MAELLMRELVTIVRLLRNKAGAVFIDVMLGVYILAILGLMFAATTTAAVLSRTKADEHTQATTIVNRELETIKNLGYGNATYEGLRFYGVISQEPTTQPYSFTHIGSAGNAVEDILPSGTGEITLTNISSTLRQITVTVTWESRTGTRTLTGSTRLAKLK